MEHVMVVNLSNAEMGFASLQRSQDGDSLIIGTLTGNFAVFEDKLTGVGAPHAQLVELLGGTKTRHTLRRKPKEVLVRLAPRGPSQGETHSIYRFRYLPTSYSQVLSLDAKLQSSSPTHFLPNTSAASLLLQVLRGAVLPQQNMKSPALLTLPGTRL